MEREIIHREVITGSSERVVCACGSNRFVEPRWLFPHKILRNVVQLSPLGTYKTADITIELDPAFL